MAVEKEKSKFWSILENLYAGAKPDGESGYVNLIQKKRDYFTDFVKPKLEEYVNQRIKDFPEFEEELYNKLYTFFEPYFSDTGSVFFVKSYIYYKQYERIYTNEDVKLFWKTKDLYYIKSDVLIRSMNVEFDEGYIFYFDASKVEHKQNNEKRELIYSFDKIDGNGKIVLKVKYSESGRQTKEDEIIKEVRKALGEEGKEFKSEYLRKAIQTFEKQMNVDYFIHRNLERFLKEQFNLWLSQYLLGHEEVNLPSDRINKLLALKDVAYRVIEVIARFEEELKRIWEKPRLVFNSNYVITLDRIANKGGLEIIKKLPKHEGWKDQVKEWIELGIIDEEPEELLDNDNLKKEYQFLPIDTKYFKDLEPEILSLFEDLDEELDGWLIKSENWQALNTILPRFKEKVQTIYIDPPFNKGDNADYYYETDYKDSTWATMLENRLRLARELLKDEGSIFVRCDYNGNWIVRPLMNEIFGEENFRNEIIVGRTKTAPYIGTAPEKAGVSFKSLMVVYDNLYLYSKGNNFFNRFSEGIITEKRESYWKDFKTFFDRDYNRYELLGIVPEKGCSWMWRKEVAEEAIKNYQEYLKIAESENISLEEYWERTGRKLNFIKKEGNTLKYWVPPSKNVSHNNWSDLEGYGRRWKFPTENSEILLKRVIQSTSNEGDLVLDFFLGSGTTTATAHKLRRKWIGIEMGEHFYTVILPRMKKVLAYDKSGISKEKDVKEIYNEKNAGGFFKYYDLEQYEEILRNVEYNKESNKEFYEKMIENFKDVKFSELNPFLLDRRLAKVVKENEENIEVDFKELYPDKEVDLLESMANVLGKSWKEVKDINDKEKKVEFYRRILLW
ncbi:DNA methyltransferase [Fervidobacterium gondwanense]|uniref:DNA methyltransferase n=1 Tax=Fervidobacterium gondwanense TaxID=44754 RepID=UPI003C739936